MKKGDVSVFLGALAVLMLLGGIVAYEAMIWNECRADDHSWFYCLRMIQK